VAFDGDWPAFVQKLGLTGMAGMVARHGEMESFDNNHLMLVVPETHRMYAEKAYADKLKAELMQHFGPSFRLTVRMGSTKGVSIAAERSRDAAQKQAKAAEAIEGDPFVRDLVRDLGAEVIPTSIRPSEDAGNPPNER
jgi:DNA polymerase-3 subunit gamma/tau